MKDRALYFLKALGLSSLFIMAGPFFIIAPVLGLFGTIPYSMLMAYLKTGYAEKDLGISVGVGIIVGLVLMHISPILAVGMYYHVVGLTLGVFLIPFILSDVKKKRKTKRKK